MKVKVADNVLVTTGKDKGKTGKVAKVYQKTNRVVVEGINQRVRHIKKRQGAGGEKITFDAPFNISNVQVICPVCKKAIRVGYKKEDGKKKIRICRKCNETIDTAKSLKKASTKK